MRSLKLRTALVGVLVALVATSVAQTRTYIALGDSLAWGYQPDSVSRDAGDKGYVKLVADWLGTQQGVRPRLRNLGLPGESSSTFFDTSEIGYLLNSNYPIFGRKSQANTFKSLVAQEHSAGRVVTHLSFALGGNDMLDLLTEDFLALPYEQQTAIIDQTLATVDSNVNQALVLVRQELPNATLVVPGYYNPYGAFPGSPIDRIGRYALPKLNALLKTRALQFNGGYADVFTAFVGRELELTWIGEDDIHPRTPGYSAYATRIIKRLSLNAVPIP